MASTTVSVMAKAPAPAMTTAMAKAVVVVMNAVVTAAVVEKATATATAMATATTMAMAVEVVTAVATTTGADATRADATKKTNYSRRRVMAKKYIVKKDDKVILETESEAKAERLYEKLISDRKERYESVELTYPPWSDRCTDGGVRIP